MDPFNNISSTHIIRQHFETGEYYAISNEEFAKFNSKILDGSELEQLPPITVVKLVKNPTDIFELSDDCQSFNVYDLNPVRTK
ncbi:MAG: hypothetical protein JWN76_2394 [Chitinophagaceae bacterium]|nr:hypothetical protein [Chitinophagaceae bacterium]